MGWLNFISSQNETKSDFFGVSLAEVTKPLSQFSLVVLFGLNKREAIKLALVLHRLTTKHDTFLAGRSSDENVNGALQQVLWNWVFKKGSTQRNISSVSNKSAISVGNDRSEAT